MENANIEVLPQAPIVNDTDMELALKIAERNEQLCRRIKILAIKQTNTHDWKDMGGKPYLQSTGAEKIARLFGISWKICAGYPEKSTISDENGSYYMYTFKGEFSMGGKTIEAVGTATQKDKFLGQVNGTLRPASEIDEGSILKKAYTNMTARGITTILGIRNLTWEEVRGGGVSQSQTQSINYKSAQALELEGFISEGGKKTGSKNGKTWMQYHFTINNIRIGTFDTKLGEAAAQAKQDNAKVKVTYKSDGKFNTLETLEVIAEENLEAENYD